MTDKRGLGSETFETTVCAVHVLYVYRSLSLYVYTLNFICALAHVLCILSPRPEVIVTDVKLSEKKTREAEDHIQAGYRGQKPSQALPCWVVLTITGPFSSRDQERPTVFRGWVLWVHWVSSRHGMCMQPDISTKNPCI